MPRYLILSTDAEKAFNHMDWDFLSAVLRGTGLGPHMLHWNSALYVSPTAQVKVNGGLSTAFPIRNGTRQACPLWPLLFALVLEPLLQKVRANQNIRGVQAGSLEHKLSAYADNILFHVVDPHVLLPNLMGELTAYGKVSNFRINYTKSEILPITVPPTLAASLKGFFPFTWSTPSMKYLGVQLTDRPNSLYPHNYIPLLKKIS